jgi:REP element-mobilizing transposase RayT
METAKPQATYSLPQQIGDPMVIAYHLIWTGYGWWLPNDPRGSGSREVRVDMLRDLGEVHYGRRRIQPPRHLVREFYAEAHKRLRFDPLQFDAADRQVIAEAFADTIRTHRYTCYAAAIMPDPVHLLIRKHRERVEQMIDDFQAESRAILCELPTVPGDHPVWIQGAWKVFLDTPADIRRTVRYIEQNPGKDGLAPQHWSFVTPYDDWPLHKRR